MISSEVSKKLNDSEFTSAKIMLAINNDTSEAKISADKIDIDGKAVRFKTDITKTIGPFTTEDLNKAKKHLIGVETLTSEEMKKYDISEDGEIDINDIANIALAVSNGGYRTFSGSFEINPYSNTKTITVYNNETKRYSAIFSLVQNYISSLKVDDLTIKGDLEDIDRVRYLKPINLYNNSSGTTGTVMLNENIQNFKYLEIFYKETLNGSGCHSVKAYSADGETILLFANSESDTNIRLNVSKAMVSGNSITRNYNRVVFVPGNTTLSVSEIAIVRVDGYM